MSNEKVSLEVAEAEFERFVELMGFDVNTDGLPQESIDKLDTDKYKIIRAIKNGSMVISEAGEPVFNPLRSEVATPFTFHEPTASVLHEIDRGQKGKDFGRNLLILAALTRRAPGEFNKLKLQDFGVCLAVMSLFLAEL